MARTPYTTEIFIEKARQKHGDKYGYSKVKYRHSKTSVIITCPIHGDFEQTPNNHFRDHGCPECGKRVHRRHPSTLTTKTFVEKAIKVHGNQYNYSETVYLGSQNRLTVICPKHGPFRQVATIHLKGCGCKRCADESKVSFQRKNVKTVIQDFRKMHRDRYDYSRIDYLGSFTDIEIICPTHGPFWQLPHNHLSGRGCSRCSAVQRGDLLRKKIKEVIRDFRRVHGNKYDYSQIVYLNGRTKVRIACPSHGPFQQRPTAHKLGEGCPLCFTTKGEERIARILEGHDITFIREWTDHDCILSKRPAKFDFYLPNSNMLVEFDGQHHFEPVRFGGCTIATAKKNLKVTQQRDRKKNRWAKKNGYKLIRIKYTEDIEEALRTRGPYCIQIHEEEDDEIPAFASRA